MRMLLRALLVVLVASTTVFVGASAQACHQYLVTATSPVIEGEKITVRIERDSADQDSSVQLRTVDGSARAGSDYKSTVERIAFTGAQQRKEIQIPTIENTKGEPTKSFTINLSGAQGCSISTDYDYGNPEPVSIKDDDSFKPPATKAPATTAPTPAPAATPKRSAKPTSEPSAEPTDSAEPTALPTPEQTPSSTPSASPGDDDGDLSPALVGLAIGALVLAAGLAGVFTQRRRRGI